MNFTPSTIVMCLAQVVLVSCNSVHLFMKSVHKVQVSNCWLSAFNILFVKLLVISCCKILIIINGSEIAILTFTQPNQLEP